MSIIQFNKRAILICCLVTFICLATLIIFVPERITALDLAITEWVASHRQPGLTHLFKLWTRLANPVAIALIAGMSLLCLYHRYRSMKVLTWYLTSVGFWVLLVNPLIKWLIKRPRPDSTFHLVHETTYSFPSGHAITSVIVWGFLVFILSKEFNHEVSRWILCIIGTGVIVGIGLSRIYLGVHYSSDVIAGFALGLIGLYYSLHPIPIQSSN